MANEYKVNISPSSFSSNDPNQMSEVEIIIPFHDECSKVANLVNEIFKLVQTNRYQITLVDDCSTNKHFLNEIFSKKLAGVSCLRTEKQMGFAGAVNHALKFAKNPWIPWICVMHSDVVPRNSSWLSKLGSCMQKLKKNNVKMVSPLTNNSIFNTTFCQANNEQDFKEDVVLDKGFLPMYTFLCHRELFKKVGLLYEYPLMGCEAEEFAIRMRKNGFYQAVCGSSFVTHEGESTYKNIIKNDKNKEILRNNRFTFMNQNKDLIKFIYDELDISVINTNFYFQKGECQHEVQKI